MPSAGRRAGGEAGASGGGAAANNGGGAGAGAQQTLGMGPSCPSLSLPLSLVSAPLAYVPPPPPPAPWRAVHDALGRLYFSNDETGATQWQFPCP